MTQIQHAASAQSHATRKTILIVEDDPSIAEFLKMAIAQETLYHPLLAETGERAFEIVQHVKPSLFVLDHVLGFIRTFGEFLVAIDTYRIWCHYMSRRTHG